MELRAKLKILVDFLGIYLAASGDEEL